MSIIQTPCPSKPTLCLNRGHIVYNTLFASFNRLFDGYLDRESAEMTDSSFLPVHIGRKAFGHFSFQELSIAFQNLLLSKFVNGQSSFIESLKLVNIRLVFVTLDHSLNPKRQLSLVYLLPYTPNKLMSLF